MAVMFSTWVRCAVLDRAVAVAVSVCSSLGLCIRFDLI